MTIAIAALAGVLVGAALAAVYVSSRARDEVALARSTAEQVLANASEAVIACAADGVTITAWNPAAERMFGWTAAEVLGRQLPTLAGPDAELERAEVLSRVRHGEQVSVVTKRVRSDGRQIDVRINYSAISMVDGSFGGWMGTLSDVTEELSLERERAQRAELVERLNAIAADLNAELDLSVVLDRITSNAAQLLAAAGAGFAIVEEGGARIAAGCGVMSEWVGYRFAPGEGAFLEAFAENRQITVEDYQANPNRVRLLHDVASAVITPVRVRDENIGALAIFFGEPGRHASAAQLEILRLFGGHAGTAIANARAYGAMARGRALAQEVLDRLVDGVAVVDEAGNVTRWNRAAAQLTGLLAGEVLGRPFPWRTGTRVEPSEYHLREDVWMETIAAPLPEAGGSMVVLRDVSRHKALQEAKSVFLATVSHELRTPLTVVAGFARRLHDRIDVMTDDERAAAIDAIRRKSVVLERTIDQLMAGSLAELGRLDVQPRALDLGPVLHEAAEFLTGASARHSFTLDIESGLAPVLADEHAVESVMAQLLENAVKYSPEGGTIRIEAVTGRDDVVVSVIDEGVGLRPGEEESVFDRFARGAPGGVRGTGLGLFIVQRLVEAQHGRVWARRNDGKGATFAFSLPRA